MDEQTVQSIILTILVGILVGSITNIVAHWLALARDKRREHLERLKQCQPDCEQTKKPATS